MCECCLEKGSHTFLNYRSIFFLLLNSLAPVMTSRMPDAIPVIRIEIPMTRLAAPEKPMVLYTFSSIRIPSLCDSCILPLFTGLYKYLFWKLEEGGPVFRSYLILMFFVL